jgi:hypothetical protein
MQAVNGIARTTTVNQVIPLRNQVSQRATLVTEGNATIHTAGGLLLDYLAIALGINLFPVLDSNWHRAPWSRLTLGYLEESSWISHW